MSEEHITIIAGQQTPHGFDFGVKALIEFDRRQILHEVMDYVELRNKRPDRRGVADALAVLFVIKKHDDSVIGCEMTDLKVMTRLQADQAIVRFFFESAADMVAFKMRWM